MYVCECRERDREIWESLNVDIYAFERMCVYVFIYVAVCLCIYVGSTKIRYDGLEPHLQRGGSKDLEYGSRVYVKQAHKQFRFHLKSLYHPTLSPFCIVLFFIFPSRKKKLQLHCFGSFEPNHFCLKMFLGTQWILRVTDVVDDILSDAVAGQYFSVDYFVLPSSVQYGVSCTILSNNLNTMILLSDEAIAQRCREDAAKRQIMKEKLESVDVAMNLIVEAMYLRLSRVVYNKMWSMPQCVAGVTKFAELEPPVATSSRPLSPLNPSWFRIFIEQEVRTIYQRIHRPIDQLVYQRIWQAIYQPISSPIYQRTNQPPTNLTNQHLNIYHQTNQPSTINQGIDQ